MINRCIKILGIVMAAASLAACAGPTYVSGKAATIPVKFMRVGVVAQDYQLIDTTSGLFGKSIPEASKPVGKLLAKEYVSRLNNKGIPAMMLPDSPGMAKLLEHFSALPHARVGLITDHDYGGLFDIGANTSLKNVKNTFDEAGIDMLIFISGRSGARKSALQNFKAAGLSIAASVLLHGPVSGGSSPSTRQQISVVSLDGRFIYSDIRAFTRNGDLLDNDQRAAIEETMLTYLLDELKD